MNDPREIRLQPRDMHVVELLNRMIAEESIEILLTDDQAFMNGSITMRLPVSMHGGEQAIGRVLAASAQQSN